MSKKLFPKRFPDAGRVSLVLAEKQKIGGNSSNSSRAVWEEFFRRKALIYKTKTRGGITLPVYPPISPLLRKSQMLAA